MYRTMYTSQFMLHLIIFNPIQDGPAGAAHGLAEGGKRPPSLISRNTDIDCFIIHYFKFLKTFSKNFKKIFKTF